MIYTLMKSAPIKERCEAKHSPAFEQQKVASFALFENAVAACDKANLALGARHYLINDSGQEYYQGTWID